MEAEVDEEEADDMQPEGKVALPFDSCVYKGWTCSFCKAESEKLKVEVVRKRLQLKSKKSLGIGFYAQCWAQTAVGGI